jgi:hypothetical protein
MTSARDTLTNGLSTASYTARGPAVLCKSITLVRKRFWNLWEATHIVGKPAKTRAKSELTNPANAFCPVRYKAVAALKSP